MQHYFTHTDTDLSSLMLTKSRDTWESQNSVKDNKNNDCISWKFHCLIRKVIWEVHLSEKKKKKLPVLAGLSTTFQVAGKDF